MLHPYVRCAAKDGKPCILNVFLEQFFLGFLDYFLQFFDDVFGKGFRVVLL